MKRFRFSLETVLRLRHLKEEEELKRLSIVVSELNQIFTEREFNEKEIERSYREIESSAQIGTSLDEYLSIERYIQGLMRINEELSAKIEKKNQEVNLVRVDVLKARKDKRVLEILRENRYLEWKKKRNRQERRELEEYNEMVLMNQIHADPRPEGKKESSKKIPKTFKILNREDGGDELMGDFKNLRDFYEKYYMGQGR